MSMEVTIPQPTVQLAEVVVQNQQPPSIPPIAIDIPGGPQPEPISTRSVTIIPTAAPAPLETRDVSIIIPPSPKAVTNEADTKVNESKSDSKATKSAAKANGHREDAYGFGAPAKGTVQREVPPSREAMFGSAPSCPSCDDTVTCNNNPCERAPAAVKYSLPAVAFVSGALAIGSLFFAGCYAISNAIDPTEAKAHNTYVALEVAKYSAIVTASAVGASGVVSTITCSVKKAVGEGGLITNTLFGAVAGPAMAIAALCKGRRRGRC